MGLCATNAVTKLIYLSEALDDDTISFQRQTIHPTINTYNSSQSALITERTSRGIFPSVQQVIKR